MRRSISLVENPPDDHQADRAFNTANIIAALLLRLMPRVDLNEMGLSDETQHEWAANLEAQRVSSPHKFTQIAAFSLYLSTRTLSNFKKASPLLRKLKISPEMVHSLSQIVRSEEGRETEELVSQVFFERAKAKNKLKTQKINEAKKEMAEKARTIASRLWSKEKSLLRLGEMAEEVKKILVDEGYTDLPETIETIKDWIRPVAPPEAKRPGKPRKRIG